MASESLLPDVPHPLKLLSLDGGGIRGLSSLIILKYLMKRINPANPPRPCEYFDLIGGTSTGGLIAIMLGRLKMDIDECIDNYIALSSAAFQPKRVKGNIFGKAKDKWNMDGKYNAETLAVEIRKIVQKHAGDPEAKLADSNTQCKTFVCAFTKSLNTATRLRTYTTDDSVDALSSSKCAIWQAARATSAAPTFFDPITIGRQTYVDGGTGYNNPVEVVFEEAKSIWPDAVTRVQCLVSVGTGFADLKDFGDNALEVIETLKNIATETEETEKRFSKNHAQFGLSGRYFRFNVQHGLGGVGMDEHKKLNTIEAGTEQYLQLPNTRTGIQNFLAARASNSMEPLDSKEKDAHMNWLKYVDPLTYHNDARQNRIDKSTGAWFINDEFNQWKKQPQSFLWLTAKAGSGKTVLSSTIIDEIEQQKLGIVAFFYFSFRNEDTQDVRSFLISLLLQIVRGLTYEDSNDSAKFHLPRAFRNLYKQYHPATNPTTDDLKATILGMLAESENTYFVADALDELSSPIDRVAVVKFLEEVSLVSKGTTHIIITSRRNEDIESAISGIQCDKHIVTFETSKINHDIRKYLYTLMKNDVQMKGWSPELQNKVIDHLTEHADGSFRWVECQILTLRHKKRARDIAKALSQLPKDLEETYDRMLAQVEDSGYAEVAYAALRWIAFAKRPISLREAAEASIFECDPAFEAAEYSVSFDPTNRFPKLLDIRTILAGLVTVSELDDLKWFSDEDPSFGEFCVVSFAHFSVKEFLEAGKGRAAAFKLVADNGNWFLMQTCLEYIKHYELEAHGKSENDAPYALLTYACKYWWQHALPFTNDDNQRDRLSILLHNFDGNTFRLSVQTSGECRSSKVFELISTSGNFNFDAVFDFDIEDYGAIHDAIRMDSCELVTLLLDSGCNVNPKIRHGSPLISAAIQGNETIMRILLERGANVGFDGYWSQRDDSGIHEWTPLHWAARNGHEAVVQLLLGVGVNVNRMDDFYRDPLFLAILNSHGNVVRVLLENGADIEPLYKKGRSVLHLATIRPPPEKSGDRWPIWEDRPFEPTKNRQTVEVLLEKGANIEAKDQWGGTPLYNAAKNGYEHVIPLLVEHGADIECASRYDGVRPIHCAASEGHDGTVRMLLDLGADITAADNAGQKMIHFAAKGGNPNLVRFLLEQGAEVNCEIGTSGRTALHVAAEEGQYAAARELIEKGANVNAVTKEDGAAPLHLAAERARVAIIELLIDSGADIEMKLKSIGGTALHIAANEKRMAAKRVYGASEEEYMIVKEKRQKTFSLLVERGANMDAEDNYGTTPKDICRRETAEESRYEPW